MVGKSKMELNIGRAKLAIMQGDIAAQATDAIVNAANTTSGWEPVWREPSSGKGDNLSRMKLSLKDL